MRESGLPGYRYREVKSACAGIAQRWLVVYSIPPPLSSNPFSPPIKLPFNQLFKFIHHFFYEIMHQKPVRLGKHPIPDRLTPAGMLFRAGEAFFDRFVERRLTACVSIL
jgi:hypothetical protein